jgi:hypothetical protein
LGSGTPGNVVKTGEKTAKKGKKGIDRQVELWYSN